MKNINLWKLNLSKTQCFIFVTEESRVCNNLINPLIKYAVKTPLTYVTIILFKYPGCFLLLDLHGFIEISCFQITNEIYVVWNTIPHFDLLTKDFLQENDNDFLSWKHHSWKYIFCFQFYNFQTENRIWDRINSRHHWQCCLTEDNYLACIRSCVGGQWGSVRVHHELSEGGREGGPAQHDTNTIGPFRRVN